MKIIILLIGMVSIFQSYAGVITKTHNYGATPLSVDATNTNATAVTFVSGVDFPATDEILSVVVSISFTKTDGTCGSQNTGNAYHEETSFRLNGPSSNERLIRDSGGGNNTYSGGTDIGTVTVVFDQSAGSTASGTPVSGTFLPDNGNLDDYIGESPFGNWAIRAGDDTANDPLCLYSYSITITTYDPLPIELVYFNAFYNTNMQKVELDWTTASERDNDYFTIERSKNGIDWYSIGLIDGAGNSNTQLNYSYIDQYPFFGISYYRLKQTDFNGNYTNSDIKSIENKSSNITLILIQNQVMLYGDFDKAMIISLDGKIVSEKNNSNGQLTFTPLSPGIYLVKTINNEAIETRKIIIN